MERPPHVLGQDVKNGWLVRNARVRWRIPLEHER
jgi:hypothetical protein